MLSFQFWVLWLVLGVFLGCSACSWGVRLFRSDGSLALRLHTQVAGEWLPVAFFEGFDVIVMGIY